MWLSTVWLCIAAVLAFNGRLLLSAIFLAIYLAHLRWEKKRYPKRRKY